MMIQSKAFLSRQYDDEQGLKCSALLPDPRQRLCLGRLSICQTRSGAATKTAPAREKKTTMAFGMVNQMEIRRLVPSALGGC